MAKKRLNTKLLLILLVLFLVVGVIGGVAAWKYRFKDPLPFKAEGEKLYVEAKAMLAENQKKAEQVADPEESYNLLKELNEETYNKTIEECYKAYANVVRYARKRRELRKEALSTLADIYLEQGVYSGARKALEQIVLLETDNYSARRKLSEFDYDLAQNMYRSQWHVVWPPVKESGGRLIELKKDDVYGYILKAHSMLQLAEVGVSDIKEVRQEVEQLLEKIFELDEKNVSGYMLRAKLAMSELWSAGEQVDREALYRQGEAYLREAIEKNPADMKACENLLDMVLLAELQESYRNWKTEQDEILRAELEQEYIKKRQAVLAEIDIFIERFPEVSKFYVIRGRVIQAGARTADDLIPAIEMYEQALAKDGRNSEVILGLAQLYRVRADLSEEGQEIYLRVYDLLRRGLFLSDAVDIQWGPRSNILNGVRLGMMQLMIDVSARLANLSEDEQSQARYLGSAKKFYGELEDRIGENNAVTKFSAGMIAWAEGEKKQAIRYLYQADDMYQMQGQVDGRLKIMLYRVLRDTQYVALAVEYGMAGLSGGQFSDRTGVELMETMVRLPGAMIMNELLAFIEVYNDLAAAENPYIERVSIVKAQALVRLGRLEEAREVLAGLGESDEDLRILRAQVLDKVEDRVLMIEKLIKEKPADPVLVDILSNYYLSQASKDPSYYGKALATINAALEVEPENTEYIFSKLVLEEPDPNNISVDRMSELKVQSLEQIKLPYERALQIGRFYLRRGNSYSADGNQAQAVIWWRKAKEQFSQARSLRQDDITVLRGLFGVVLKLEEWDEAQELIGVAGKMAESDVQLFEGDFKTSRAMANEAKAAELEEAGNSVEANRLREEAQNLWSDAIDRMDRYLQENPLSSDIHTALAQACFKLQRYDKALEHAQKAVQQDKYDLRSNLLLAGQLHYRNLRAGLENLTQAQVIEMAQLLDRIAQINSRNETVLKYRVVYYPKLLAFQMGNYEQMQGLTDEDRVRILANFEKIHNMTVSSCRELIKMNPAEEMNWQALADVIYQYAQLISDSTRKQELYEQTEGIYKEALEKNPDSQRLAQAYRKFLDEIGRTGEVEKMLLSEYTNQTGEPKQQARLKLAGLYYRHNLFEPAERYLKEFLEQEPDNVQAAGLLAEVYAKTGNMEKSVELLSKYRTEHKNGEMLVWREIELLLQLKRLEEAEQLLDGMKDKDQDKKYYLLLSSQLERSRANYVKAVEYADQLLLREPGNINALMAKAEALYYDKRLTEAEDCLKQARAALPVNSNQGRTMLSMVYWSQGNRDAALAELEAGLKQDPGATDIRRRLIQLLWADKRMDELERVYAETIKLYPKDYTIYVEAAEALARQGDEQRKKGLNRIASNLYKKAMGYMDQALQLSNEQKKDVRKVLISNIDILMRAGGQPQYERALSLANQGLGFDPKDIMMMVKKSEALYGLARKPEALSVYEQALALAGEDVSASGYVLSRAVKVADPAQLISWCNQKLAERPDWVIMRLVLANLYISQGDRQKQIDELEAARAKAPEKYFYAIDQQLAISYELTGQHDKSIACYRSLLEATPDNSQIMNNLAYSLFRSGGHEEEAVKLAEKAYQLANNVPDIMDTYAIVLLGNKDYDRAVLVSRQAIQELQRQGEEVRAEYLLRLGQGLAGQGNKNQAMEQYQEALQQMSMGHFNEGEASLREQIMSAMESLDTEQQ
ncbi:MAG: tetratricopeptide repeat protein [Sedimentisphaerales bacterium]|nr:tetratricopeptide repeat protein [Sedimentisphaerales bacterium]